MVTRWQNGRTADDSREYIERFDALEHEGTDLHGEARFVDALVPRGARILDAGCGAGRVGSELARRGHTVVGVDLDPVLVEHARSLGTMTVHEADLATLDLAEAPFDAIVAAGNVVVFVEPGTEPAVLARLFASLAPGGVLVTGASTAQVYGPDDLVRDARAAGFEVEHRFATWDLRPWRDDADWQVMVARRPVGGAGETTP